MESRNGMQPLKKKMIDKILIRAANWVGDAVMSTPMVRAVRRNFPGAEIAILAKPWVAPVFEQSADVNRVLIYDAKGKHAGAGGILRLARELRRERFDLAVLVQNAFEAALIAFLAGIPHRLGYDRDGRRLLLTHAVPVNAATRRLHQIDYYLGILCGAGLPAFGREMTLDFSPAEREAATALLADAGVSGDLNLFGLNPGAAFGSAKRWLPERFAEVGRRLLHDHPDGAVLIFGGPGEKELGEAIRELIGGRCVNFAGRTTLRRAMALIERCRLFITNDSGLMHVAAALDVPQVAVFGSTDHATTSPSSSVARMVRVPLPCSPCMKPHCPLGDHACMERVTTERVLAVVDRLLPETAAW